MEIKKQHFIKSYQFWIAVIIIWFIWGDKNNKLTALITSFIMAFFLFGLIVFVKRKVFGSK